MTIAADPPRTTTGDSPSVDPGPRRLSPSWTPRRATLTAILAAFVAMSLWSLQDIGVNPLTLWTEREDLLNLFERMFPVTLNDAGTIWDATIDTFLMAFVGTFLGVVLAIPLAFASASNIVRNPIIRGVAKAVIVITRAIPDLVFAAIFVRVYSVGVLPGIMALAIHSIGMLGKLFADTIEQIDPRQREGVVATGAGRFQELATGVLPQIIPSFIAVALYRLDINFRSATLLGLVGAGGIGLWIRASQGSLDYPQLLGITLVIMALIVLVELISTSVRGLILGQTGAGTKADKAFIEHGSASVGVAPIADVARGFDHGATRVEVPGPAPLSSVDELDVPPPPLVPAGELRPPWTLERIVMWSLSTVTFVTLVLAFTVTEMSLADFILGLPDVPQTMQRLVPTSMDWWQSQYTDQIIETVAMGFAATGLALFFGLPTAYMAARNVAPARWIYGTARGFILLVRALPDLVIAVIFVAALGLGPKPGVLALAIGLYGFATKLFADAIEEASEGPRDGIRATGATRTQEAFSGVTPQVLPSLLGNSLYLLDVSIRSSAVLGIVGAGGIGFTLVQAIRLLEWQTVGGLLIIIFVIVYAIELLATWVRKQVI